MKRKITLIITVLIIALSALALSACVKEVSTESEFGKTEYSYTNPTKAPESENGILYDGVLDEDIYDNAAYWYEGYFGEDNRRPVYPKSEYQLSVAEGKLFVYLSDTGVHVAADVKEDVIFTGMYAANGRLVFNVSKTGITLFLTDHSEGNTVSMEWQLTAGGGMTILKNRDGYNGRVGWSNFGSKIGTTINAPNGNLDAEGYIIEAFAPYENTPFKEKPKGIGVVFGLNRVQKSDVESENIRRVFEVSEEINGVSTSIVGSWLPVDGNGWVNNDGAKEEIFGNEQFWKNEYDGKTLEAVSYDNKIYDTRMLTNSTDFNDYVPGVNYDPDFDETKEKGVSVKAVLKEDGLYFDVKARHNLIREGNSDWGQNNNIEANFTAPNGRSRTFYIAQKGTNSDGTIEAMSSAMVAPKIVTKLAPSGVNYKYETDFYGFISIRMLETYGLVYNVEENPAVRLAIGFRSGGNNTVKKVAIPLSELVGDGGKLSDMTFDTNLAGTYVNADNVEETYDITKDYDGNYLYNGAKVTLRRVQYATATINSEAHVLYYLDFPEENDSIYSLGAHSTAKPYIWYPFGSSPYGVVTRKFITADGIAYGYKATDAVIDGVADDEIWTEYKGYTASSNEVFASYPTTENIAKEGRSLKVKAVKGSNGLYLYAEVIHNELNYVMPYAHWISNLDIQLAMTPKGSEWDAKTGVETVSTTAPYGSRPYTLIGSFNVTPIGCGFGGFEHKMISSKVGEYYLTKIEGFIAFEDMNITEKEGQAIAVSSKTFDDYDLRLGVKWRTLNEFMRIRINDTEDKSNNQWYDAHSVADLGSSTDSNGNRTYSGINRMFYVTDDGLKAMPNAISYTIDGDASDWANHSGYQQTVTDEAASNKQVTYKAKLTAEGLYYIVQAKTATYYPHHGFSKGTTLVIKTLVNSSSSSIAMVSGSGVTNAYGKGGNGIAKGFMAASTGVKDGLSGLYTVTMEGFIPNYWLVSSGVDGIKTGDLKLAFEFTPANSTTLDPFTQGGKESIWWKGELASV